MHTLHNFVIFDLKLHWPSQNRRFGLFLVRKGSCSDEILNFLDEIGYFYEKLNFWDFRSKTTLAGLKVYDFGPFWVRKGLF